MFKLLHKCYVFRYGSILIMGCELGPGDVITVEFTSMLAYVIIFPSFFLSLSCTFSLPLPLYVDLCCCSYW